jgi:hypothetical protein
VRAGLFIIALGLACGQTDHQTLTFDAATVRPVTTPMLGGGDGKTRTSKTGREKPGGGPGSTDPGRIHYPSVTLKNLLTTAYDVKDSQVLGPDWLDTERFAVEATMPKETTKEQFHVMLQNLSYGTVQNGDTPGEQRASGVGANRRQKRAENERLRARDR